MITNTISTQSTASSSKSVRVNFETVRSGCGPCASVKFKIERRFPLSLQSYLSQTNWDDFCDQVDNAFITFTRVILPFNMLGLVSFLVFSILVIIQVVIATKSSSEASLRFVPIIIAFVLSTVLALAQYYLIAFRWSSMIDKINSICREFTTRYPSLYIRFRDVEYTAMAVYWNSFIFPACIEFEFSSSNVVVDGTVTIAPLTNTTGKTIEEKMADLESNIQKVLSDQE